MQVVMKNITRLCSTKATVTVNGKFPGPTIYAREDDTLLIKVVNQVHYNLTIHWLVLYYKTFYPTFFVLFFFYVIFFFQNDEQARCQTNKDRVG